MKQLNLYFGFMQVDRNCMEDTDKHTNIEFQWVIKDHLIYGPLKLADSFSGWRKILDDKN